MIENEQDKFLNQIPKNSKIALWGTGVAALGLKKVLFEKRNDVKVRFFIDTFKTGEVDSLKIYAPESLSYLQDEIDLIILTSFSGECVIKIILREYTNKKYLTLDADFFKTPLPEKNIEVLKILETNQDEEIYKMVARAIYSKDFSQVKHYIHQKYNCDYSLEHEYFDFINKDSVKTAIDGGANNGSHILLFKENFKNLKKVYSFDPLWSEFKSENIEAVVKDKGWSEVFELGLWNKKESLTFVKNGAGSHITGSKSDSTDRFETTTINTISLDEFVQEQKIEKVDFIKLDIEGAEMNALKGAQSTILKDRPQMAISIYHSKADYSDIALYLNEILTDYIFKIGHYGITNCGSCLYAIPKELYT